MSTSLFIFFFLNDHLFYSFALYQEVKFLIILLDLSFSISYL